MVLGARRRVVAAIASAAAALSLALAATGRGCDAGDTSPEGAARAFVGAARAGDVEGVFALLGPKTRARLEKEAESATDKAGGARRFGPLDMLEVGPPPSEVPVEVVLRERRGDTALVAVLGPDGRHDVLTAVRVGAAWRIELDFGQAPESSRAAATGVEDAEPAR